MFLVRTQFVLLVGKECTPSPYADYASLEADFAAGKIHPADLKQSVVAALDELLGPIRERFNKPDMLELIALAYPPEVHAPPYSPYTHASCRRACMQMHDHIALDRRGSTVRWQRRRPVREIVSFDRLSVGLMPSNAL
jgi:hypothetical protein